MDLQLRGRRAAITGASKGIGLAIARVLAAEGVDLVLCSRTQAEIEHAATQIAAEFSVRAQALAADLSGSAGVTAFAHFAEQQLETVDILVNNAGAIPAGSIAALDFEEWQRAYDLKLWGYVRLSRSLLPAMRQRRTGVILNIIGNAGRQPTAAYIAGGMANAALMNFTKALALECAGDGVRVVGINPGLTATERLQALAERMARERGVDPAETKRTLTRDIPLGRPASVAEVADVAAFLVSPRASYITGAVIPVEGGATASV